MAAVELRRGPSRRQVLSGLATMGAISTLGGCFEGPAPREVPVSRVRSTAAIGHRLRDGWKADPESFSDVGVVIIGAGIAGLSAGWALRHAGFDDFVVLELDDVPGGTSSSGASDVSAYPNGAHYVNVPFSSNVDMVRLLDEMGLLDGRDVDGEPVAHEAFACRAPEERHFLGGRWFPGLVPTAWTRPDDQAQLQRFEAEMEAFAALRDARDRRYFAIPASHASDDGRLDALKAETFDHFLNRSGYTSRVVRWLCDYACRDDFGARPVSVSAFAGVHYFASRGRGDGREGQPILTFSEGNGRFVRHLVSRIGAERIRLNTPVLDVSPLPDGGVEVKAVSLEKSGGQRPLGFRAKRVIFAAPQMLASRLVRPYREAPPAHLRAFTSAPWLVAQLHLDRRPKNVGFDRAWDNVPTLGRGLGYIDATHQRGIDHGPTVLTYYEALVDEEPAAARAYLMGATPEALRDRVLGDLRTVHRDLQSGLSHVELVLHGHGMVIPTPELFSGSALKAARQPHRGLHFAHTELSGMALFEEALDHGTRAAQEVLVALDRLPPGLTGG